jgi:hypothetical protein
MASNRRVRRVVAKVFLVSGWWVAVVAIGGNFRKHSMHPAPRRQVGGLLLRPKKAPSDIRPSELLARSPTFDFWGGRPMHHPIATTRESNALGQV